MAPSSHVEPFYATAEFMVAIALGVFLFFVGQRAFNLLGVALDDRAERIKDRIDEAARLAEDAQAMLATYERKQRDAAEEAESILAARPPRGRAAGPPTPSGNWNAH